MMSEKVNSQAVYLELAMQLLVKAGLNPLLRTGMDDDGRERLVIELDRLPVAVIRRRGQVEIGVVEVFGRDGDG